MKGGKNMMDFGRIAEIKIEVSKSFNGNDRRKMAKLLEEVRDLCRIHTPINACGETSADFAGRLSTLYNMLTFAYCEQFGKIKCPYLEDVEQYIFGFGSLKPNPCPNPIHCKLE